MPSARARLFAAGFAVAAIGFGGCTDGAVDEPDFVEPYDFGEVDTMVDLGDAGFDAPEPDRCGEVERLTAVRIRSAPGGRQLHVSLHDEEGVALNAGFVGCLAVEDERLGPLPLAQAVAPTGPGATMIVARWTPSEASASRTFIDAFLAQRPADERVSVWAWSDSLVQVVGATTDREAIARRLDAVWTADDAAPGAPEEVAVQAAEEWERLSSGALLGPRTIVFVAPDLSLEEIPDIDRDFVTDFWVLAEDNGARQFAGTDPTGIDAAAESIGVAIDSVYDEGLSVLAFCDDGGPLRLSVTAAERVIRRVGFGDAAVEHRGAGCDLQRILDTAPPEAPTFSISFTDDERAAFDRAAEERDSRTTWTGALELGGDPAAAPFEGSFRGRSSLGCERKSISINLDGGDRRHALPASGTDEFFLISMCLDDRYVNQLNADRLFAEMGLWELEFGTAEVLIDGATRGVYLFVEEIDQELRNDRSGLRAVIRRRTDIDGKPADVEHSFDSDEAALERYDSFLADVTELSGDELVDALEQQLDVDQYLRWVALMTLLGNGDYIDEVFFVAEASVDAAHQVVDYYTVHGWDPDDLFSDCHHDGRFAINDPNGLLYCTESLLDHHIFADPLVYDRYVDVLEEVIESVTPDRFRTLAEETRDELLGWFADAAIRDAMVELLAANPDASAEDVAIEEITGATESLISNFESNRDSLIEAIVDYRTVQ